ncbi:MAG: DUF288 domain-containing protein [Candidatus Nealsonbacteria bacterium]|nr:MAG: DUF288 domain-containing protein [Candidatus Nealsonbacteria bacterium]
MYKKKKNKINKFIVITTINPATKAIKKFASFKDWKLVLVGDKKSKAIKSEDNTYFLSIEDQKNFDFNIVNFSPYNHYSRKNIGYLYAMKNGADIIYETDDDNFPTSSWSFPDFHSSNILMTDGKYFNIYRYFTSKFVWPRGFPLDEIRKSSNFLIDNTRSCDVGVWSGMANNDPDVDAIFRLLFNKEIKFRKKDSVALDKHIYSPFNSQNTLWNKNSFAWMYLPVTVNPRFTDILRGYIAQRLFWHHNLRLGFIGPTVYQERNSHNLMKDFSDELECYSNIKEIVSILESTKLGNNIYSNIRKIYKNLAKKKYVRNKELETLGAWLKDIKNLF